jgi:hypothetical protein
MMKLSDSDKSVETQFHCVMDDAACRAFVKNASELTDMTKVVSELAVTKEGWEHFATNRNVVIDRKSGASSADIMVRGRGIIEAPAESVLICLWDLAMKKLYDAMFEKYGTVGVIDSQTEIHYHRYAGVPLLVAPRDFVLLAHWEKNDDGSYVIAAKSVDVKDVPHVSGVVRAEMSIGGFLIRPLKDNPLSTEICLVGNTNLKGRLPNMICRQVYLRQPMMIDGLRTLLKKENRPKELDAPLLAFNDNLVASASVEPSLVC